MLRERWAESLFCKLPCLYANSFFISCPACSKNLKSHVNSSNELEKSNSHSLPLSSNVPIVEPKTCLNKFSQDVKNKC